ncbi:unnamed protein product [Camellia sinensis]
MALSKRIHYGKFVAEDRIRLMDLLTYPTMEEAIKRRVEMKAKTYENEVTDNNNVKEDGADPKNMLEGMTHWLPNPMARSPISVTTSSSRGLHSKRMALLDSSSRPHLHRRHLRSLLGLITVANRSQRRSSSANQSQRRSSSIILESRRFCQATGYGGTVQHREMVFEVLSMFWSVEEKIARHAQDGTHTTREIVVQFNADVVRVKPGESALAFYTVENQSSTPITGVSTYNVTLMKKLAVELVFGSGFTFKPDLAKFNMTCLEDDVVALMKNRVIDLAGCLGKTVKVDLNGQRIPVKSFLDYVNLYLQSASKARLDALPRIAEKVNDRWEICVSLTEGQFQQASSNWIPDKMVKLWDLSNNQPSCVASNNGLSFALAARKLKEKSRVVAMDLRGHGKSSIENELDLSIEWMTLWNAFKDEFENEKNMLGGSLGRSSTRLMLGEKNDQAQG